MVVLKAGWMVLTCCSARARCARSRFIVKDLPQK
jgi:hypothetical protein